MSPSILSDKFRWDCFHCTSPPTSSSYIGIEVADILAEELNLDVYGWDVEFMTDYNINQ